MPCPFKFLWIFNLQIFSKLDNLEIYFPNNYNPLYSINVCVMPKDYSPSSLPSLVLEMYGKLQNLMKERHYYSALKTLEQLEHIHLPCVRGYIFSELLAEEIPRMRESIEKQSMAELKVEGERVRECESEREREREGGKEGGREGEGEGEGGREREREREEGRERGREREGEKGRGVDRGNKCVCVGEGHLGVQYIVCIAMNYVDIVTF